MSKHSKTVDYILSLEPGHKISVRGIAIELGISEGTAYKAIKECDEKGIVSTIPRVGTIRVDKLKRKKSESLTFADVVNIVGGSIIAGRSGIHKSLKKLAIGAMTIEAMSKYIEQGSLLIVGNRDLAQELALNNGAAVLVTGGFQCNEKVKRLADEKSLPIISSKYDSFITATMINKAMTENTMKKDIILVEDIMKKDPYYLKVNHTLNDWKKMVSDTNFVRYPVVDEHMKVVGIITSKDLSLDVDINQPIGKIMSKNPITVTPKTTVAYAAYVMGLEDIELCPVIDGKKLIGIIKRDDVTDTFAYMTRQPQRSESLEELILANFEYEVIGDKTIFTGNIASEMIDSIGTASWSSLNMLLSAAAITALRERDINVSVDNISTYFMKPLQLDTKVTLEADIVDMGRNYCKVEVNMINFKRQLIGKSMLSAKMLGN
ncbi:DRTGG domain-containing protein [Clostridium algidicarnis]|uniref:CBS domain-containing protein n=1 Tax=Clostridium algidicarnis TaxID=37659 RepID=A0ABS6C4C0_9CLOT|nr:DRTGG domain-containing protein [Clostridium algidicarnis]MBB6697913.1 CBS domain-containing protein [Clostridium algidicarnis]MBU3196246.1 CBS domain-containing protein [Clostridium algidicarnis]MBU3220347.1 CBS domain-containing protein [Clostridium algidicarnis]MCB2287308.1 CBS domain-containing protein [Clostridium algidicarnis]